MLFGQAFEIINEPSNDFGMRLPYWDKGIVVKAHFPDRWAVISKPYVYIEAGIDRVPYTFTQEEMFSNEWEIVEK